jgi:adenosylcobyric acid synthase
MGRAGAARTIGAARAEPTIARCVMVQGTASGVGKSLLTAALCRIFARRGYRVAPFKAQNMALNAAVTVDGGEIGRAQAAQAEAAGIEPTVDMNPILLKPEGGTRAQVVVRGVALGTLSLEEYRGQRDTWLGIIAGSLARLRAAHDLVVIEGAGSPAEINLAADDLANMRIARLADAPVLLVGDIDRGGVFAALVGTLALLDPEDRRRVGGLVVNKLRGDATLLAPGVAALAARTGVPVLGVIPHLDAHLVAAEDALDLDGWAPRRDRIDVAVPRLPRIANFDDLEPLAAEPGVSVRFVTTPAGLDGADLVVLPGSKAAMPDLAWLRERGLAAAIIAAAGRGRPVLGVCGGYQMLGRRLHDPDGVESPLRDVAGLGLLPVETTFRTVKTTARVRARVEDAARLFPALAGREVDAYEIHAGMTRVAGARPGFTVIQRGRVAVEEPDGAVSDDGPVVGTYLHGLLADGSVRAALLAFLARRRGIVPDPRWGAGPAAPERHDRLADAVAAALDVDAVAALAGL